MSRLHLILNLLSLAILISACSKDDSPNGSPPTPPPDTLWTRTFGGPGFEEGSAAPTSDGGSIIIGRTESFGAGQMDFWLLKVSADGDSQWSKPFGGGGNDWGCSVEQTTDGGYILTGKTASFGSGMYDMWIIKTDGLGTEIWKKPYGGVFLDDGNCVKQTLDGGYIVVGGYGISDYPNYRVVWLIKINANGDSVWSKQYGGQEFSEGDCVQQTEPDSGYIIVATTRSINSDNCNIRLIKTDVNGDSLWTRTFGGSNEDAGIKVRQTLDGGYILVGWTDGFPPAEVYLIKTDTLGNEVWSSTFSAGQVNFGVDVKQTQDNGYIVVGHTGTSSGMDGYIIKTDAMGREQWRKTIGGPENDQLYSVYQDTNGEYVICGGTESYGAGSSDVWLIRLAAE